MRPIYLDHNATTPLAPEALDAMLRPLPPETFWTVTCIGRHHQRMLALALLNGGVA